MALLIGGERYLEHAEQVALDENRREQAALEKQAQEQAALEKQGQDQAALEKQQREKAALEKQQRKQAALKKKRQEQAALEKQAQEQAALEKQRQDQAALEKQQRDQAALEKQQREKKAALEKQRQDQAAMEKQRQEQAFVAVVGRPPHPGGMNDGDSDLHVAARLNLPLLTVSLLEQGADVLARNKDGWTPLHVAAKEDASATAEVLLRTESRCQRQGNIVRLDAAALGRGQGRCFGNRRGPAPTESGCPRQGQIRLDTAALRRFKQCP